MSPRSFVQFTIAAFAAALLLTSGSAYAVGGSIEEQARSSREKLAQAGYSVRMVNLAETERATIFRWAGAQNSVFGEQLSAIEVNHQLRWGLAAKVVIAEYQNVIVGVILAHLREFEGLGREYFVRSVDVAEGHRRRGIATSMMLTFLAEIGEQPVRLEANLDNKCCARTLYQRLGFTDIYGFGGRDVLMRRPSPAVSNDALTAEQRESLGLVYDFLVALKDVPGDPIPTHPVSLGYGLES